MTDVFKSAYIIVKDISETFVDILSGDAIQLGVSYEARVETKYVAPVDGKAPRVSAETKMTFLFTDQEKAEKFSKILQSYLIPFKYAVNRTPEKVVPVMKGVTMVPLQGSDGTDLGRDSGSSARSAGQLG